MASFLPLFATFGRSQDPAIVTNPQTPIPTVAPSVGTLTAIYRTARNSDLL